MVVDLVCIFPYSLIKSEMIFLRWLKVAQFNNYLGYFTDFISGICQGILNPEQIKYMVNVFKLFLQIMIVSHFCACIWLLTGGFLKFNY